jgi:hypothetical protein
MRNGSELMGDNYEKTILERVERPGWVTTRGVLLDPTGSAAQDEIIAVEQVMRDLAGRGLITLWRLIIEADGQELLAAARTDLELDKDLEDRGAWAKAIRY